MAQRDSCDDVLCIDAQVLRQGSCDLVLYDARGATNCKSQSARGRTCTRVPIPVVPCFVRQGANEQTAFLVDSFAPVGVLYDMFRAMFPPNFFCKYSFRLFNKNKMTTLSNLDTLVHALATPPGKADSFGNLYLQAFVFKTEGQQSVKIDAKKRKYADDSPEEDCPIDNQPTPCLRNSFYPLPLLQGGELFSKQFSFNADKIPWCVCAIEDMLISSRTIVPSDRQQSPLVFSQGQLRARPTESKANCRTLAVAYARVTSVQDLGMTSLDSDSEYPDDKVAGCGSHNSVRIKRLDASFVSKLKEWFPTMPALLADGMYAVRYSKIDRDGFGISDLLSFSEELSIAMYASYLGIGPQIYLCFVTPAARGTYRTVMLMDACEEGTFLQSHARETSDEWDDDEEDATPPHDMYEAVRALFQLVFCRALRHGFLHFDLKCDNVLHHTRSLVGSNANVSRDHEVKLIDFESAAVVGSALAKSVYGYIAAVMTTCVLAVESRYTLQRATSEALRSSIWNNIVNDPHRPDELPVTTSAAFAEAIEQLTRVLTDVDGKFTTLLNHQNREQVDLMTEWKFCCLLFSKSVEAYYDHLLPTFKARHSARTKRELVDNQVVCKELVTYALF